ncbi:MAG: YmaF family protein [Peptococcaceae bacterium]|nr:YmaF family protein [Peptococcaceae bacterium]
MGYGTGPAPAQKGHVHQYSGKIFFKFGSQIPYQGKSSPAFGAVDRHTHTLSGTISLSRGQVCKYEVVTGPGIPSGQGQHAHRYSGVARATGGGPREYWLSGVTMPAKNDA